MNQKIRLSRQVYDEILTHACNGKPEEICGIIRGRGDTAYLLYQGRNTAEERVDNYIIDSQTLLRQFEFEETGDEMVAVYHSHPISVAYPSATDAWNASYPDTNYIICSLEFDDKPVVRSFRLIQQWIEVDWAAIRGHLAFYETRPGLFAYYQAMDAPLPSVLSETLAVLHKPFYLVYFAPTNKDPAHDPTDFEGRIVTIAEVEVEVLTA